MSWSLGATDWRWLHEISTTGVGGGMIIGLNIDVSLASPFEFFSLVDLCIDPSFFFRPELRRAYASLNNFITKHQDYRGFKLQPIGERDGEREGGEENQGGSYPLHQEFRREVEEGVLHL
jgi:hypothetical protein